MQRRICRKRVDGMALRVVTKRLVAASVLTGLGTVLGGCNTPGFTVGETITRGYVLDEKALGDVRPGTSVEAVLTSLGTPTTVSTVGNKTFYYISQIATRRVMFLEPSITDQRVLAVYFDRNFKVERVANYGFQDGQVFDFISRSTPSSGQERSFVRQIFQGMGAGSFNPLLEVQGVGRCVDVESCSAVDALAVFAGGQDWERAVPLGRKDEDDVDIFA